MTSFADDRTPAQKALDARVLDRVKRGIAVLKEVYGDDFADHINLSYFDITSGSACVLGQLYDEAEPTQEQLDKAGVSGDSETASQRGATCKKCGWTSLRRFKVRPCEQAPPSHSTP